MTGTMSCWVRNKKDRPENFKAEHGTVLYCTVLYCIVLYCSDRRHWEQTYSFSIWSYCCSTTRANAHLLSIITIDHFYPLIRFSLLQNLHWLQQMRSGHVSTLKYFVRMRKIASRFWLRRHVKMWFHIQSTDCTRFNSFTEVFDYVISHHRSVSKYKFSFTGMFNAPPPPSLPPHAYHAWLKWLFWP